MPQSSALGTVRAGASLHVEGGANATRCSHISTAGARFAPSLGRLNTKGEAGDEARTRSATSVYSSVEMLCVLHLFGYGYTGLPQQTVV